MPDFFLTLERQLALEVDSPEIRDYVRSTYARTRIARPVRGVPLDRAAIHGSGPQPSVEFNGTKIDLEKSTAHSAFRFGFYGSNRLFRESFRRNDAWLSFHGAALALPAGAIVAVAESGAGKTTLALALLDRGARLLSDEFVFVRKTDRVVSGYPRTFMIREPALAQIENRRVHQRCAERRLQHLARDRSRRYLWPRRLRVIGAARRDRVARALPRRRGTALRTDCDGGRFTRAGAPAQFRR
jgi:hypothetical protein